MWGYEMRLLVTMHCLIDWLSFTLPNLVPAGDDLHAYGEDAFLAVQSALAGGWDTVGCHQSFSFANGRAPYLFCLRRADHGVSIFFDRRRSEILVEMSGTGCATARLAYDLTALALRVASTVTRVDLTVDVDTMTKPTDFVDAGFSARFKSGGRQFSVTGETCYVGSWSSNRFARIYRYAEPHPRAGQLRIEHVFRDESATAALAFLSEHGLVGALAACGEIFKWKHEDWIIGDAIPDERMIAARDPKTSRDSVSWVYRAVIPALAMLLLEKRIDWDDVVEHVQSKLLALRRLDLAEPIEAQETDDE